MAFAERSGRRTTQRRVAQALWRADLTEPLACRARSSETPRQQPWAGFALRPLQSSDHSCDRAIAAVPRGARPPPRQEQSPGDNPACSARCLVVASAAITVHASWVVARPVLRSAGRRRAKQHRPCIQPSASCLEGAETHFCSGCIAPVRLLHCGRTTFSKHHQRSCRGLPRLHKRHRRTAGRLLWARSRARPRAPRCRHNHATFAARGDVKPESERARKTGLSASPLQCHFGLEARRAPDSIPLESIHGPLSAPIASAHRSFAGQNVAWSTLVCRGRTRVA